ncbi:hypothetical protein EON77_19940, partial [bacterium]
MRWLGGGSPAQRAADDDRSAHLSELKVAAAGLSGLPLFEIGGAAPPVPKLERVARTFVRETRSLVHIRTDESETVATPEHPFWVDGKGFVAAGELQAGDVLATAARGASATVRAIRVEETAPTPVFNFEVENAHTYYAGPSSVLVHNVCQFLGEQYHRGYRLQFKYNDRERAYNGQRMEAVLIEGTNALGEKITGELLFRMLPDGSAYFEGIKATPAGIGAFYPLAHAALSLLAQRGVTQIHLRAVRSHWQEGFLEGDLTLKGPQRVYRALGMQKTAAAQNYTNYVRQTLTQNGRREDMIADWLSYHGEFFATDQEADAAAAAAVDDYIEGVDNIAGDDIDGFAVPM